MEFYVSYLNVKKNDHVALGSSNFRHLVNNCWIRDEELNFSELLLL